MTHEQYIPKLRRDTVLETREGLGEENFSHLRLNIDDYIV